MALLGWALVWLALVCYLLDLGFGWLAFGLGLADFLLVGEHWGMGWPWLVALGKLSSKWVWLSHFGLVGFGDGLAWLSLVWLALVGWPWFWLVGLGLLGPFLLAGLPWGWSALVWRAVGFGLVCLVVVGWLLVG